MRKYIIGAIIGAALVFSTQAVAEEVSKLLGKTIEYEVNVSVHGQKLETKAPLIDGTTYVPLRAISEKLGLVAKFENGEVLIQAPNEEQQVTDEAIRLKLLEIDEAKTGIRNAETSIPLLEKEVSVDKPSWVATKQLENLKAALAEVKQKLTQLQDELKALEDKKAELEKK